MLFLRFKAKMQVSYETFQTWILDIKHHFFRNYFCLVTEIEWSMFGNCFFYFDWSVLIFCAYRIKKIKVTIASVYVVEK